ncbi:MAG TPA: hypothetical protein VL358_00750 [Caulobacteraceae bacterium]|jgi:hypothetical protein|nr:hypothetical protein [Caulobacteraceae bacterium]
MTDEDAWKSLVEDDLEDLEGDSVEDGGETEDLAALKNCLQALADAIASTNLAVINGTQGDAQAAGARVQASVAALKRFHEAFTVLKGEDDEKA